MHAKPQSARFEVRLFIAALLFSVNLSAQQQVSQSSSQSAQQPSPPRGVMIDPSAGPLTPSEPPPAATQPAEAPAAQPPVTSAPAPAQAPEQPATQSPVGAAAAEEVKTAGGGASRPAGNAIAPVKQHQYRSILIKLGAVAAAGIAVGTVYGLSRATPSTPPHATTAAGR